MQFSTTSHTPAAARHSVALALYVQEAVQQEATEPFALPASHCSPVFTVPLPQFGYVQLFVSAGHVAEVPLHFSVGSQEALVEARHSTVDAWKVSCGHIAVVPLHFSSASHTPAAARHTVPLALRVQEAVQQEAAVPFALPASHCSPVLSIPLPQLGPGVQSSILMVQSALHVSTPGPIPKSAQD